MNEVSEKDLLELKRIIDKHDDWFANRISKCEVLRADGLAYFVDKTTERALMWMLLEDYEAVEASITKDTQ
jgi:hypothetical protein